MSEIKAVTHEGQVYQLEKPYLFSISGVTWFYDKLIDIDGGYSKPFCTKSKEWLYIKEVPASEEFGTITPTPIELDHECAYMFDCGASGNIQGIYNKNSNRMMLLNGWNAVENCTNIRLMTVGSE
jgi:hypothetical protein